MDNNTDLDVAVDHPPIACTLTTKEASIQVLEWVDLQHRATAVAPTERGVRMTLPASLLTEVEDLVRREAACCAFLTIDTSVAGEVLTLDISSANPDALPVIFALAGIAAP